MFEYERDWVVWMTENVDDTGFQPNPLDFY